MFQKEGSFINTKGNTPLKKSIRRKLRDDFLTSIIPKNVNTDHIKDLIDFIFIDSKSEVSIRKLKRKDTNSNAGATNIYSRTSSPSSSDDLKYWPYTKFSQVLMLEADKTLLPSLALLSVLPVDILNQLPTVVVPPIVSKYLCRGADCMRSGMLSMPSSHNGWVVIRALENSQPFAIGFVTNGTDSSTIGPDTKGVGVQVVSCYGDEIYRSQFDKTAKPLATGFVSEIGGGIYDDGNYGNVGFIEGKRVYGLITQEEGDENAQDEEERNDNDEANEIQQSMENVEISSDGANGESNKDSNGIIDAGTEADADANTDEEEDESSVLDPESTLLQAFHDACVRISKSQFPMTTSEFYSQHILPARKEGTFINLKDTRFKKLGVFLMEQATKGVITLGASNGDPVAFLKAIDRSHVDLRDARSRKKDEDKGSSGDKATPTSTKSKLALAKLFIIPKHIVTLMALDEDDVRATNAKSEDRRGTGYLTSPECRAILNRYILQNNLVDEFDPEMVTVDGPLCDAVFRKSKKQLKNDIQGKNNYKEAATRKEINEKWLERMEKAYAIVSTPGSVIMSMKRGVPPKVSFVVEARQSRRKFVTRVRGLEEYGINPDFFANDVSKRFACSSSIEREAAGRETLKKGHVECVFQGNLVEELSALLLGNEKLSSHGGAKNSEYSLPKGVFNIDLKKGVSKGKNKK